jgi:hypothetical protein
MKFSTALECAIVFAHDLVRGINKQEYEYRDYRESVDFRQFSAVIRDVHVPRHVHVLHAGEVSHFPTTLIQAIDIGSQMYQLHFNYCAIRRIYFQR